MIYVQCMTHAVNHSVVDFINFLRYPVDAEKEEDNIDVQLTCMHFSRTRGGVFFKTIYLI